MTSSETPGHRIIRVLEKPDPSDHEREQKRQRALQIRPELVARIDQGIRERVPMKNLKDAA